MSYSKVECQESEVDLYVTVNDYEIFYMEFKGEHIGEPVQVVFVLCMIKYLLENSDWDFRKYET